MNDGMYTNIRNYLEELASLGRQMLAEQQRTNELLNEIRLGVNRTDGRAKDIGEVVQNAMTDMLVDVTGATKAEPAPKKTTPAKGK